jgi:hypothetical protein
MRIGICVLLIISCALIFISCNTTEPPPPPDGEKPTLELKLEDVSCTEAWIELTTTNLQLPTTLTLKQINPTGDTLSQDFILNTQDSLLYTDSLMPNIIYTFQSSIQPINQSKIKSNELIVTTMDTTSHNFTFETFTFGGTAGTSTLYDVAIINENDIWAVGEIYVTDTSQNGYTTYNAVHWDGIQWELKRIYYYGSCSAVEYPPLKAIWAFSENSIIITNGGSIGWFDGNTVNLDCRVNPLLTGAINKIWGTSSEDLYIVGNNGNIVHYNGTTWQRIESGTDLNIGDIWGIPDSSGGYNKYLAADNAMLKIDANNNLYRIDAEQGHSLSSVWAVSNRLIYTAGGYGLSLYKNYSWKKINEPDVNTIYNVRGQDYNDVFGLSSTFFLLHFNGFNWQYINTGTSNVYYRQDVKGYLVVAVGWQGDKATITVIRRNN